MHTSSHTPAADMNKWLDILNVFHVLYMVINFVLLNYLVKVAPYMY